MRIKMGKINKNGFKIKNFLFPSPGRQKNKKKIISKSEIKKNKKRLRKNSEFYLKNQKNYLKKSQKFPKILKKSGKFSRGFFRLARKK